MIRLLTNEDFLEFLPLNLDMYKSIDSTVNAVGATATLTHDIMTKKDFILIGLFDDVSNKLIGFTSGYGMEKNIFYFSGIYVIIKNNDKTKKLIDFSFDYIKQMGYTSWEVDTRNENISSIMEKYGAKKVYTKYHKDLIDG